MSIFIGTSKGILDLIAPETNQIDIIDVAHSLSNLCRFLGHSRKFYSVAEHSVWVSKEIEKIYPHDYNLRLYGLLHDASEAFVGDLPTPLKSLLGNYGSIYGRIEKCIQDVILFKYKVYLSSRVLSIVDDIDKRVLATEAIQLFSDTSFWDLLDPLDFTLVCWKPEEAENQFLSSFGILNEQYIKKNSEKST
jgi:5'-deoxynucleotidase YfbR-like HD superfamily hydrolase